MELNLFRIKKYNFHFIQINNSKFLKKFNGNPFKMYQWTVAFGAEWRKD
jgi:hypothetical protein